MSRHRYRMSLPSARISVRGRELWLPQSMTAEQARLCAARLIDLAIAAEEEAKARVS